MDRLLADAKAGRLDVVVFPSIDRAGRSVCDVIEIDRALRGAGVDTVFLREGVDTSTPTGELFRNIMASLAEFEGRVIYERLSKGKRKKASEGGYTGNKKAGDFNITFFENNAVPRYAIVVKGGELARGTRKQIEE
jgi:DNA invertase Pin-like site-specific DNA recombinase